MTPRPDGAELEWRVAWTILLPRPRDCCYYHAVDWHQVSAAAIRVTRQARGEGVAGQALNARAQELAGAEDLPAHEEEALDDLMSWGRAVQPSRNLSRRPGYGNGRHRITAMFDAGVRRTVVLRRPPHLLVKLGLAGR